MTATTTPTRGASPAAAADRTARAALRPAWKAGRCSCTVHMLARLRLRGSFSLVWALDKCPVLFQMLICQRDADFRHWSRCYIQYLTLQWWVPWQRPLIDHDSCSCDCASGSLETEEQHSTC